MYILRLCFVIGAGLINISIANSDKQCSSPLGMENGKILKAQLSASSSYEMNSVGPNQARLNNNKDGGAWCPKSFISEETGTDEFLEIDLGEEHRLSGVVTQGRYASGLGQEYAEMFLIQYWRPGMPDFQGYEDRSGVDLFTGNSDTYTEVETILNPPVVASRVRIIPFSRHPRTVCMRVELLGCKDIILESSEGDVTKVTDTPRNDDAEKYVLVEQLPPVQEVPTSVNHHQPTTNTKEMRETMVEVDLKDQRMQEGDRHEVVVLEPWWETEYMGVAVGVLVTVILILIVIIVFILYKNYKTGAYPPDSSSHYYETRIPKFDHPEAQWLPTAERKLTIGSRKLPPTPTTSEEHYTDSSAEYSSPLLSQSMNGGSVRHTSGRQQIYLTGNGTTTTTKSIIHPDWESFFPSPPPGPAPGTPPRLAVPSSLMRANMVGVNNGGGGGYMKPVSHYAATDVIASTNGKIYGKHGGNTYFL